MVPPVAIASASAAAAVVWDFDHSMIDVNSDLFVPEQVRLAMLCAQHVGQACKPWCLEMLYHGVVTPAMQVHWVRTQQHICYGEST